MKLQKESLWILLALIVSPFYFVYRETLEVKDGEVRAYKTLWSGLSPFFIEGRESP